MRVMVLGGKGMLGVALHYEFLRLGFETVVLQRPDFDAIMPNFSLVDRAAPDAVVNAIGLINRRYDRPEAEFLSVNSIFPRRLADWCAARQIPLIHVSTDCVFRGDAGPYDEESQPDATDLYGRSKTWGEATNALVIRTSIIGPEIENHYALLCWFLRQQDKVRGFGNHLWNGVTTLELGRILGKILVRGLWQPGVRHIHGEDLSKFALLEMIRVAFAKNIHIEPFDDTMPRDTRLCSRYPDFLEELAIRPMAEQLLRLREVSDGTGHWTGSIG